MITTNQIQYIKQIFNLLNPHVKEINLIFTPDGRLIINHYEELNITINCELNNDNCVFSEFICNSPIPIKVGVCVPVVASTLKNSQSKSAITMFVESPTYANRSEIFGFSLFNTETGKITRIEFPTIDVDCEDRGEIDREFYCCIKMDSADFLDDINQLKVNNSDTLQICYYNGVLKFFSKSGNANIEVTKISNIDYNEEVTSGSNEHINIYVKLTKLIEIVKFSSISKRLKMLIKNNEHLILEFDITNMGRIYFAIPTIHKPENW